ncbi:MULTISPECIES: Asp23/Gls24 family envelope stress response protein [unclassified Sporosarcina]|uniref:Asp23/Gls24 family envelope stress response protein n=1 Tax=unclassified Sporosarcina TaxID=2647733 RepID=UPI000C171D36|nr:MULTISPECIES: Asp23/Gls24 family envelope stress response protein [unclassified Sporosarcina]PID00378.1 Asp23/Gls24 family envelope stress response protein [Sporosarcina sp. P29]PID06621.1 Asp23/Gls24 family envelope stress response protein [Sporosarcina sp. P30]PID09815.1 Asp23/Gls24 family envelope stress response protein [Sporosarcina sp. P31]PID13394.1 Asp23/Gls24 family envelope stress response protein [Sporosarcina sp. P32b]
MADKTNASFVGMTPSGDAELGRVQLAPEVLEVIIGIATSEVSGVIATQGNFASGVAEKLGKVMYGKGVKTEWADEGLKIDVYCIIEYGHSIPTIAAKIQNEIRQAILNMTSLHTHEVNVHITGIHFED